MGRDSGRCTLDWPRGSDASSGEQKTENRVVVVVVVVVCVCVSINYHLTVYSPAVPHELEGPRSDVSCYRRYTCN